MNVIEVEQATRQAWPAMEERGLSYGVLRYAGGVDRRANSLNLFVNAVCDSREMISATEDFFGSRNATPIVRIVQAHDTHLNDLAAVELALESSGYETQALTQTMSLDLNDRVLARSASDLVSSTAVDVTSWLQSWYQLTARSAASLAVHEAMLSRLHCPHAFLLAHDAKENLLSSGMAVLTGDALGLFGIATAMDRRQQGHATAMLQMLLDCASARGARYAYLQVEASNTGAIKLYRKLGFEALYSYWYRVGCKQESVRK